MTIALLAWKHIRPVALLESALSDGKKRIGHQLLRNCKWFQTYKQDRISERLPSCGVIRMKNVNILCRDYMCTCTVRNLRKQSGFVSLSKCFIHSIPVFSDFSELFHKAVDHQSAIAPQLKTIFKATSIVSLFLEHSFSCSGSAFTITDTSTRDVMMSSNYA